MFPFSTHHSADGGSADTFQRQVEDISAAAAAAAAWRAAAWRAAVLFIKQPGSKRVTGEGELWSFLLIWQLVLLIWHQQAEWLINSMIAALLVFSESLSYLLSQENSGLAAGGQRLTAQQLVRCLWRPNKACKSFKIKAGSPNTSELLHVGSFWLKTEATSLKVCQLTMCWWFMAALNRLVRMNLFNKTYPIARLTEWNTSCHTSKLC